MKGLLQLQILSQLDFQYDSNLAILRLRKLFSVNISFYEQHACFDKHQNYDIINLASFDATSIKCFLFCRVRIVAHAQ